MGRKKPRVSDTTPAWEGSNWQQCRFQLPRSHFHFGQKMSPSPTPRDSTLSWGRNWVHSGLRERRLRGTRPLASYRGRDAVTPFRGARQPPHPGRACAPLRAAGALGPRPRELPEMPGDSSPGTVPLWGASFSPPLGPTPAASRTPATPRRVSATCSGAGEPGAPAARASVRARRAHGAAGQQRQLPERCVRAPQGPRVRPALRAFPSPPRLSLSSSPAVAQTGEGWASATCGQARLGGRSRDLADFPFLQSRGAERGIRRNADAWGGRRRRRRN